MPVKGQPTTTIQRKSDGKTYFLKRKSRNQCRIVPLDDPGGPGEKVDTTDLDFNTVADYVDPNAPAKPKREKKTEQGTDKQAEQDGTNAAEAIVNNPPADPNQDTPPVDDTDTAANTEKPTVLVQAPPAVEVKVEQEPATV
jgi:hypothetical protein